MREQREQPPWMRLASGGFDLAIAIGAFAAIGWWLDGRFGWKPWGVLTGAMLGLVGGLWNLLRNALIVSRQVETEARERRAARDRGDDGV